jgi:hypothetical protein
MTCPQVYSLKAVVDGRADTVTTHYFNNNVYLATVHGNPKEVSTDLSPLANNLGFTSHRPSL